MLIRRKCGISTAQLIVPIVAILALLLFGGNYGVKAVMFGMVVGQLLNLLIVQYYLKYYDASLLPRLDLRNQTEFSPLLLQYLPLVVSAFFVAVAAPVSTLLAIHYQRVVFQPLILAIRWCCLSRVWLARPYQPLCCHILRHWWPRTIWCQRDASYRFSCCSRPLFLCPSALACSFGQNQLSV